MNPLANRLKRGAATTMVMGKTCKTPALAFSKPLGKKLVFLSVLNDFNWDRTTNSFNSRHHFMPPDDGGHGLGWRTIRDRSVSRSGFNRYIGPMSCKRCLIEP